MKQFTLRYLPPHLLVAEPQLLSKTYEEVHQRKGCHEVGHLMIPGVLQLAGVRIQEPHKDGLPPQEEYENLL